MHVNDPMEALDIHLAQWEWCGSAGHQEYADRFAWGYSQSQASEIQGPLLAASETSVLNLARTFYITPQILGFISEAAAQLPPAPLRMEDIPVETGMLIFPEPVPYWNNADGREIGIQAVAWGVIHEEAIDVRVEGELPYKTTGVMLYVYGATAEMDEMYGSPWPPEWGVRPPLILNDLTAWGSGVVWAADELRRKDIHPAVLAGEEGYAPDAAHPVSWVAAIRKLMLSIWTFMAQEVVPQTRFRPPRPNLRRWERSGMPLPEDGCITVLHYRPYAKRQSDEEEEAAEVEWSHRWWRRAHWRVLHRGTDDERAIWVHRHVVGPEDKPLVIKERLGVIDR